MANELIIRDVLTEDFMGVYTPDAKKVVVSTRKIAEIFTRQHDKIISSIENRLETLSKSTNSETKDFRLNFIEGTYKSRGKIFKEYLITKNGFIFIVMNMEGLEAEELKIRYINTFDKMTELIATRQLAKIGYKDMGRALKEYYERKERLAEWYHYSNEADMINKIVLGTTAKKFREENNVDISEATRDVIPEWKLKIIDKLERLDTDLIDMDYEFEDRKIVLQKRFDKEKINHNTEITTELDKSTLTEKGGLSGI